MSQKSVRTWLAQYKILGGRWEAVIVYYRSQKQLYIYMVIYIYISYEEESKLARLILRLICCMNLPVYRHI